MLEQHVIQAKGFRNVDGGFQVVVRCPYYRGIWTSLLEDVQLVVDGETFAADRIAWALGGKTYTTEELSRSSETRWPFEEPAVLTVERAADLEPGVHDIEASITWRWSYIPVEMQPTTNISKRRAVLVS